MSDESVKSEEPSESPDIRPQTAGSGPAGAYRVRLDLFEGPLDLLLHLIKKNDLSYLDLMRELSLDVAGEYLVMAATLLLIKSRMLLPSEASDDEEERDPRADLVRQLLEYQRYREAAASLQDRPRLGRDVFIRAPNAEGIEPDPDALPSVRVTTWHSSPTSCTTSITQRVSLSSRKCVGHSRRAGAWSFSRWSPIRIG